MKRYLSALLLTAFLLSPSPLRAASPKLEIQSNGRTLAAPATFTITTKVERSEANRGFILVLDCDSYYRDSFTELDKNSPTTHPMVFRDIPEGSCWAVVILFYVENGEIKQKSARTGEIIVV